MYKFELNNTNSSSDRLGNCEVCQKHVSDVFVQTKYKKFSYENKERFSHVSMTYGHKNCLESIQS